MMLQYLCSGLWIGQNRLFEGSLFKDRLFFKVEIFLTFSSTERRIDDENNPKLKPWSGVQFASGASLPTQCAQCLTI